MELLISTIDTAGPLAVSMVVGRDVEFAIHAEDLLPGELLGSDVLRRVGEALGSASLPSCVVMSHPDAVVAEQLLGLDHEVIVATVPEVAGGPSPADVLRAHPAGVIVEPLTAEFGGLTIYNSALLTVVLIDRHRTAIAPLLADLVLERLATRFPRRLSVAAAHTARRITSWVAVPPTRAGRLINPEGEGELVA